MEKTVTKTAATVDEAVAAAIAELGCSKEDAKIEVISEGAAGGFLGVGKKDAEVKVTAEVADEAEAAAVPAEEEKTSARQAEISRKEVQTKVHVSFSDLTF
jgi:spoIIIJ-associated protein